MFSCVLWCFCSRAWSEYFIETSYQFLYSDLVRFFTGFERWLLYSSDVGFESKTAISHKNLSVVISLCLILCPSEDLVLIASYDPNFVSLLTFQSTPCRRSSRKMALSNKVMASFSYTLIQLMPKRSQVPPAGIMVLSADDR